MTSSRASSPLSLHVPALTARSETQSLTPSIWDYVRQYGRTYHRYMAGGKQSLVRRLSTPNADPV